MPRIDLLAVFSALLFQVGCATAPGAQPWAAGAPRPAAATSAEPETPPPPVTEVARGGPACAVLPATFAPVHFELDSHEVDTRYLDALEQAAGCRKQHPEARLRVEGHADERGTAEYNLALGEVRARQIERTLGDLGLPETRVDTMSFGEEHPVASGHHEAAWAKNRRSELRVDQQ
jgi:peptidoglycan-associated lipoprotein